MELNQDDWGIYPFSAGCYGILFRDFTLEIFFFGEGWRGASERDQGARGFFLREGYGWWGWERGGGEGEGAGDRWMNRF